MGKYHSISSCIYTSPYNCENDGNAHVSHRIKNMMKNYGCAYIKEKD